MKNLNSHSKTFLNISLGFSIVLLSISFFIRTIQPANAANLPNNNEVNENSAKYTVTPFYAPGETDVIWFLYINNVTGDFIFRSWDTGETGKTLYMNDNQMYNVKKMLEYYKKKSN